jgi:hypothetical protein
MMQGAFMKKAVVITALVMTVLTAVTAHAQQTSERLTVNFSDPTRPGLLKVNLFNGGLSVKAHTGREVIIEGTPVARRGQPAASNGLRRIDGSTTGLTIEEENNVMTVSSPSPFSGGNLEIQVPMKTNLNLTTVNGGSVVVDGIDGEIEVTNINGNVALNNVSGSVVAHATNGRLTATLREITPSKPMSFTSMNANVDVTLPPTIKANLKIRTDNGEAWSDFDIQRTPAPAPTVEDARKVGGIFRIETDRTIDATINGGGPTIELRTLNGNIFLRKGK